MAGKKGKSGGARIGAGRPKKEKVISEDVICILQNESPDESNTERIVCSMKNLDFPEELKNLPYAKKVWEYVLDLNEKSSIKLINERHYEILKSYCIAVTMRQMLLDEWKKLGTPMVTESMRGNLTAHPLLKEIELKNNQVNKFAEDLGLTVLSELKMLKAKTAKEAKENEDEDEGLFD